MNDSDESKPETSDAEATAPKPRRKRAPRKVTEAAEVAPEAAAATDAPAATAPADAGESAPAEAGESAPAPKPRAPRRKRAVAADAMPDAPAAAPAEAAVAVVVPVAEPAAAAPEADAGDAAQRTDAGADGPDAGEAGAGADAAPQREGRRRNRRRNRNRDRDRADRPPRADAVAGDDAAADAEEADDAPPEPVAPLEPTDPNELFANVMSGEFDATQPAEVDLAPADPAKRVLLPEPDAPKLHKVLAQAGIGSRRDMEQWVLEGRVTVNGEPAHTGQRISFGDRITVNGKPVKVRIAPLPPRVLAYHKPAGEVVTHDDPQHRPTVFRRLPRLPHGKWQSVGRLDINTEGLLLFTNSGELANQLMHPRFGVEREYAVRSLGVLDEEQRQRLLDGVEIEGQRCGFKSIEDGGGEGANHWYRVVITEGRNREVRRLFEAVGHAVSRLIRIRYGCVVLPRGLKRGVWVDLPEPDVRALRRLTGTERPRDADGDGPGGRNKRGRRGGRNRDGRGPRPDGGPRGDNPPRQEGQPRQEGDFPLNIPNPLQQTYDKRAIQQARRQPRRELTEDDPIPNPLQQTYDRRALQSSERQPPRDLPDDDGPMHIPNPLQQTYDKRFVQKGGGAGLGGGGGGGRGRRRGGAAGGGGGGQRQPDPMQTAVGYIGADAFRNKGGGKGGGKGRRGGGKPGGGGGGGGGNRGGGRNR